MDPTLLILLVVLFGGMWFMSNRSRKQQAAATAFRDHLVAGQDVMTGSGMYGTVVDVEGDVVILETSPGVETRWFKPAIAKLVEPAADEAEYDDAEYEDEGEYEEGEYEEGEYDEGEDEEGEDETDEAAEGPDDGTPGLIEDNPRA